MKIGFDIDDERLMRALRRLVPVIEDSQPMLEEAVERGYYPIMQETFDTEGRGGWQEPTAAYVKRKTERHGYKPIGQATGAMMRELTGKSGTLRIRASASRDEITIEPTVEHAKHFNRKRPLHNFTGRDKQRIGEVARENLKKRVKGTGFDVE
jgi:hypothetical protein